MCAAASLIALPAIAADIEWNNPGEGPFLLGSNWLGGVAPGLTDSAIINNGGTATVGSDDTVEIDILQLQLGAITLTGGSFTATNAASGDNDPLWAYNIGAVSAQSATVNVTDGASLWGGSVRIGYGGGSGSMSLTDSSYLSDGGRSTWVANGAGSEGSLTLVNSTWKVGGPFVVGRDGGAGVLTMSGTSLIEQSSGNTYLGSDLGSTAKITLSDDSKILNTSGEIFIGNLNAKTELEMSGNAEIEATNNWIAIGRFGSGESEGTVILRDNAKIRKTGGNDRHVVIGAPDATGHLTMMDNSLLSSNLDLILGEGANSHGTLDLQGGTVTVGGWLKLGFNNAGAQGEMTMSGNSQVNVSGTFVIADGGQGSFTMNGGTVTVTGQTWVGQAGSGVGTFTQNGGTFTSGSWIAVGRDGSEGTLNMTGGTLSHIGTGSVVAGNSLTGTNFTLVGREGEVATVNHSGGTINNLLSVLVIGDPADGLAVWNASGDSVANLGDTRIGHFGRGTLNVSGNASITATSIYMGSAVSGIGVLNLNGGTLTANFIEEGAGQGTIVANGGTLRARQAAADFLPDFETGDIEIAAGGLKFDTNGFNVGISNALTGDGGLTKLGGGTLTLSGVTTFKGASAVEEGVLEIAFGGMLVEASQLDIAANAGLVVHDTISLNDDIVLTLVEGSAFTLDFEGDMTIAALWINGEAITPDTYTLDDLKALPGGVDFDGNLSATLTVTSTVPEPGTLALLGCGAAFAMWRLRRRR
jgi:PEP-CTERM putative exosortase interaction domain/autotransporter-associated beta strand repeat